MQIVYSIVWKISIAVVAFRVEAIVGFEAEEEDFFLRESREERDRDGHLEARHPVGNERLKVRPWRWSRNRNGPKRKKSNNFIRALRVHHHDDAGSSDFSGEIDQPKTLPGYFLLQSEDCMLETCVLQVDGPSKIPYWWELVNNKRNYS